MLSTVTSALPIHGIVPSYDEAPRVLDHLELTLYMGRICLKIFGGNDEKAVSLRMASGRYDPASDDSIVRQLRHG